MTAQLRDAFALEHKLNFGQAQLLALGQILARFVSQIGLPISSVNHCVNHGSYTSEGHFLSGNKQRQPTFGWPGRLLREPGQPQDLGLKCKLGHYRLRTSEPKWGGVRTEVDGQGGSGK